MDDFPVLRQRLDGVHDASRVQLRIEAALATLMCTAVNDCPLGQQPIRREDRCDELEEKRLVIRDAALH